MIRKINKKCIIAFVCIDISTTTNTNTNTNTNADHHRISNINISKPIKHK